MNKNNAFEDKLRSAYGNIPSEIPRIIHDTIEMLPERRHRYYKPFSWVAACIALILVTSFFTPLGAYAMDQIKVFFAQTLGIPEFDDYANSVNVGNSQDEVRVKSDSVYFDGERLVLGYSADSITRPLIFDWMDAKDIKLPDELEDHEFIPMSSPEDALQELDKILRNYEQGDHTNMNDEIYDLLKRYEEMLKNPKPGQVIARRSLALSCEGAEVLEHPEIDLSDLVNPGITIFSESRGYTTDSEFSDTLWIESLPKDMALLDGFTLRVHVRVGYQLQVLDPNRILGIDSISISYTEEELPIITLDVPVKKTASAKAIVDLPSKDFGNYIIRVDEMTLSEVMVDLTASIAASNDKEFMEKKAKEWDHESTMNDETWYLCIYDSEGNFIEHNRSAVHSGDTIKFQFRVRRNMLMDDKLVLTVCDQIGSHPLDDGLLLELEQLK